MKQINEKLSVSNLNSLPQNFSSVAEAMTAFMRILGSARESLRKILIRGEFEEFPDAKEMHCTARLAEMLNQYSAELHNKCKENDSTAKFHMDEVAVIEEARGIGLPNFLQRTAFLTILQRKVGEIDVHSIRLCSESLDLGRECGGVGADEVLG